MQKIRNLMRSSALLLVVALAFVGCGGGHTAAPITGPAPVITSFTASKNLISSGSRTMLTAVFTGGTGVVSNGVGPIVSGAPIATGNLTTTTTLILTVTNATGSTATQTLLVSVVPTPVITSFTAAKATITSGTGTTLSYAFTGGPGSISPGVGSVTSGGTANVAPTSNTTYTLTVTDAAGGTVNQDVSVSVISPAHITHFTATPSLIAPGSNATLSAVFENGLGTLDHSLGPIPSGGTSINTGALTATTTFTLVVINAVGDPVSATATVSVGVVGSFASTGSMATGRHHHTATLLQNGKVLIVGGVREGGAPGWATFLASAEIYDPGTESFTGTGLIGEARAHHTATLLQSGKVLIAGGNSGMVSAELYDPATGTFTATGPMGTPRSGHRATLLPNGKVLMAGGYNYPSYLASAEVYDPNTGTFTATGSMREARLDHMATLLPIGRVLVVGGFNGVSYPTVAEIYDPVSGTFSATGAMSLGTDGEIAPLLPNGKVLVERSGGAELYDPNTGSFSITGSMVMPGVKGLTLLQDGRVILISNVGGYEVRGAGWAQANAEVYDPATGTFTATASMGDGRPGRTATLLPNGKVLITGGQKIGVMIAYSESSALLYDPSTLH